MSQTRPSPAQPILHCRHVTLITQRKYLTLGAEVPLEAGAGKVGTVGQVRRKRKGLSGPGPTLCEVLFVTSRGFTLKPLLTLALWLSDLIHLFFSLLFLELKHQDNYQVSSGSQKVFASRMKELC